ncbi:DUF5134 domain-containing protein [Gordonia tangerina]
MDGIGGDRVIADLTVRWIVTLLMAAAISEYVLSLVTHRLRWPGVIGHLLHIVMAAAMIAMAWPFGMDLPTTGPMVFFLGAGMWFVVAAIVFADTTAERAAHGYHAVMMAAMAWMYAVMHGDLLPGSASNVDTDAHMMSGHDMTGMDMAGTTHGSDVHSNAANPGYVTMLNWMLAIGFLIAAIGWLYLYFSRRRPVGAPEQRASALLTHSGELSQVFMAAGMSIMFFAMA